MTNTMLTSTRRESGYGWVILICGSRDYTDIEAVDRFVQDHLDGGDLIIHGGASGADQLASVVARQYGIHCAVVSALWQLHGMAAGPRRNRAMLAALPDAVVGFPTDPTNISRGTLDMLTSAHASGFDTYYWDGDVCPWTPTGGDQ